MKSGLALTEWENSPWLHWSWYFTQDMIRHWWPRNQSSVKLYKINVQCTLKATQSPGFNLPNHFSYAKWNQHNCYRQNIALFLLPYFGHQVSPHANFLFVSLPNHIPNYFSVLYYVLHVSDIIFLYNSMYKYTQVTKFPNYNSDLQKTAFFFTCELFTHKTHQSWFTSALLTQLTQGAQKGEEV